MANPGKRDFVLSAKNAAFLMNRRKRDCKRKIIVSLTGTVTALSNLIKDGNSQMFIVEVDKCAILLVTGRHLEWYPELKIGEKFIFQDLRLTTLQKGILQSCSVFLAVSQSSIKLSSGKNDMDMISVEMWLNKQNMMDIVSTDEMMERMNENNEKSETLIHYEGEIASVDMIGIFLLDRKIRLILAAIDSIDLSVKSKVSVYNAHMFKEGEQTYLICCSKSCIRVHDSVTAPTSSSVDEPQGVSDKKLGVFTQKIVKKYSLNVAEIKVLLQLYATLTKTHSLRDNWEAVFVSYLRNIVCQDLPKDTHIQSTDVFIYHDLYCPFKSSQAPVCRIPQLIDLLWLKEEMIRLKSSTTCHGSHHNENSEPSLWSSAHHFSVGYNNSKVLLGRIILQSEGVAFQDHASELPVLLLSEGMSKPYGELRSSLSDESTHSARELKNKRGEDPGDPRPHTCCLCCVNQRQSSSQLVCPVLDSRLIGKLVWVKSFYIVAEKIPENQKNCDSENCDGSIIYLAFCLLNCVMVPTKEHISSVKESQGAFYSDELNPEKFISEVSTLYMHVTEKQPLTFLNLSTSGFQILGYKVDGERMQTLNVRCQICKERQPFVEVNSSNTPTLFEDTTDSSSSYSIQETTKPVLASFSCSLRQWYSCITPGNVYKFMMHSIRELKFDKQFSNAKLEKVAEYFNIRRQVDIPQDVQFERVAVLSADPASMTPIHKILSDSFSETIISLQGIIVNRELSRPWKQPDVHMIYPRSLAMTGLKLDIKEIQVAAHVSTDHQVAIYLDAPKTVYLLGLLPGSVVKFFRLERKVSKFGNVYCSFMSTSTAEVVQFQELCDVSKTHTDAPRGFLFKMWRSCKEEQIFQVRCHIDKVFKLSVRLLCSSCRSAFLRGACQSGQCGSSAHPVATGHAVFLIEDGTSPATVQTFNPELIAQLLTLSSEQWQDLLPAVAECGEILVDKCSRPTSNIAKFLHALVESPLVLRTCNMVVRRGRGKSHEDLDKMDLQDFQESEVKVGRTSLKVFSLPRMQLECLNISNI